jgi:peptide/nickel transport system substrate-binding protein
LVNFDRRTKSNRWRGAQKLPDYPRITGGEGLIMTYRNRVCRRLPLAAAVALAGLLGGGAAHAAGTAVLALGGAPDSLDPNKTTTWESWVAFNQIYDTLLYLDRDGKVVPNVAKSWEVSPDGLTYTFHLHDGVNCSDGSPLTSADVKYSTNHYFDPKNPAPLKAGFGPVESVETPDPLMVTFKLKTPFAAFPPFMGVGFAFILCKGNEKFGSDFGSGTSAIGSGPFMVKEWVKGDHMTLVPNPHYVNFGRSAENKGPPKLDQLILRRMPEARSRLAALKTNEVQIAAPSMQDVEAVKSSPDMKLMGAQKTGQTIFFEFAVSRPPFNDERARKAVAYAIDPVAAIDLVFGDLAKREKCAIGPGVYGNDEDWCGTVSLGHDPEKAKALLKELGYAPEKPMEVIMMTWPDNNREKIAQAFQSQLAEVGIKADLQTMDIATLNARVKQENETKTGKGTFDMMGWGWFDPDILYNLWHSPGHYSGYQSKELDSLLEASRTTLDPAARLEIVRKVQAYLITKAIQVPLYSPGWNWLYAVRNEVSGFSIGAFDRPEFIDVMVGK